MELNTTRRNLINTKEQLRKLDIPEELPVLEHIHFAISRLNSVDNNEVQSLFKMSKEERLAIKNSVSIHTEISQLLRTYFNLRSEEHTSELQSRPHLVCRLLLEKKKTKK